MYDLMQDVHVERPSAGTAVVSFTGEHDLLMREELAQLLESLVTENRLVVVDFSEALFVDSTTLHVLLGADTAARCRGTTFRIQLGTTAIVRKAFEISGLPRRIACVSSRQEALAGSDPTLDEVLAV